MTIEQRERVSAGHMGQVCPESTKEAVRKAQTGRYVSPETCARLSVASTGHHPSLADRAKMSVAHKGIPTRPCSDETKAAISRAEMGHSISPESRAKMSAARMGRFSGALSPSWKGGITPENHRIRDSHEYLAWRTAVFERDNYTCQDCGKHGVYLEAHHIHEFSKYPDERLLVENGKTLCLPCHDKMRIKSSNKVIQGA